MCYPPTSCVCVLDPLSKNGFIYVVSSSSSNGSFQALGNPVRRRSAQTHKQHSLAVVPPKRAGFHYHRENGIVPYIQHLCIRYGFGTVSSCLVHRTGHDGRRTARYNYNTRKPVLVMSPVTSRGWVTYTHTGVLERVPHRCRAFFSPICGGAFPGREDGGGKIRERTSTISSCTSSMLPLPKCAVRWLALARDRCKQAPNMLQDVLRWYFHSFFSLNPIPPKTAPPKTGWLWVNVSKQRV